MKKILYVGVICILCSISALSQSKKKWEQTQTLNSISAYEDFIVKYPKGKFIEEAKLKLAKLELLAAKKQNTIAAFEDFIKMTSNEQLKAEANSQIDRIRTEETSFTKAKGSNTIAEISSFISKYPNSVYNKEANQILEKLYFEQSFTSGSLIALHDFLIRYPKSQYAEQINQKIPAAEFSEAITIGTDDALIAFIKSHNDAQLIKDAILKLTAYQIVDISKTITWENLKTVYCGGAESGGKKYLCGINFRAFNPGIDEISMQSLIAGPLRYYEPDVASLVFFNWTEFDGYFVKSTNLNHLTYDKKSYYTEASVKKDGLLFEENSIVLKLVNK
jgi:outer membrane protein assembly factor BamD (BamD/ComL family)